jgi:hypothetical protein
MDAGSEFGVQETRICRFISEPAYGGHTHVHRPGRKTASFQVKPIAQNHCFVSRGSEQYQEPFATNLWVSTSDREASHVGLDVIEEKICALDFETQLRAVIDAGVPVNLQSGNNVMHEVLLKLRA